MDGEKTPACHNCTHWKRCETSTTSHVKYFGTCKVIEATRDNAGGYGSALSLVISKSPVLINESMVCDSHSWKEIASEVKQ